MSFDLREPKICIIRVHATNFFSSWSTKNLQQDNQIMITIKLDSSDHDVIKIETRSPWLFPQVGPPDFLLEIMAEKTIKDHQKQNQYNQKLKTWKKELEKQR